MKNTIKPASSSRKSRASKSKSKGKSALFLFFFAVVIGIAVLVFWLNASLFSENQSSGVIKHGESLIHDDEKIYLDSRDKTVNRAHGPASKSGEKKEIKAKEKADFKAPEYGNKDKDYLNKLIKSR